MTENQIDIPRPWQELNPNLRGVLMVMGKSDVGKSTFARYVYERLSGSLSPVGYLDGDPGQSTLGPPCTMTVALAEGSDPTFPPKGPTWRFFVGSTSPRGHMLQLVVGAARLVEAGLDAGARAIVYDTTGLVDRDQGGMSLKMAKIDLLHPEVIFVLQQNGELEPFLKPLRRSSRVHIRVLPASSASRIRDISLRRAHRRAKFAHYFANAHLLKVEWPKFAVLPVPCFDINRLVAMEDANGFLIGLGIVEESDRSSRTVLFLTPLASMDRVDAIRLGDVAVDPVTFEDRCFPRVG